VSRAFVMMPRLSSTLVDANPSALLSRSPLAMSSLEGEISLYEPSLSGPGVVAKGGQQVMADQTVSHF
jgi:hypothetical protein